MKKSIFSICKIILFTIIIITMLSIVTKVNASTIAGDVDDDGEVTAWDARLILRMSVGLEKIHNTNFLNADIDGDGKITSQDARLANRMSVGLETIKESKRAKFCTEAWVAMCSIDGRTYNTEKPNNVTELEKSNVACCASYVAYSLYEMGGEYENKMVDLDSYFRSATALANKLDNTSKLFKKVKTAKTKKQCEILLNNLQPGDIVFMAKSSKYGHIE